MSLMHVQALLSLSCNFHHPEEQDLFQGLVNQFGSEVPDQLLGHYLFIPRAL